jgi:hypothetical protein
LLSKTFLFTKSWFIFLRPLECFFGFSHRHLLFLVNNIELLAVLIFWSN